MAGSDGRARGLVFDEIPELYDEMRPGYPDALFADLSAIAKVDRRSSVLEIGCGTGQATRSLAARFGSVTAVEPGAGMAAVARRHLRDADNVVIEETTFETWDDRGRRFDLILAAASWHWVDPAIGWRRAHDVLRPGCWMALIGNIVVRRRGEPDVFAETADVHQRFSPGNSDWGEPPLEDDLLRDLDGWGLVADPGELFGPTVVRWYPAEQRFDAAGFADYLRTLSPYRRLGVDVREGLLDAITKRIRVRLDDRVLLRYLCGLRAGRRAD